MKKKIYQYPITEVVKMMTEGIMEPRVSRVTIVHTDDSVEIPDAMEVDNTGDWLQGDEEF